MIERTIYHDLEKHLDKKEISLITGPRQSGKTTLMDLLRKELIKRGESTLYLNLDIEWDRVHFGSQTALVKKLELEFGDKKGYVFIDEIQRKEDAGLFLKGIYDLKLQHKFIVSGSGSLELKEKIHESLAGRKRLFELSTITFKEFINYKTENKYKNNLKDLFAIERDRTQQFLLEYMNFGGYPRIVLEPEISEKSLIIDEIYRSVLEKDISYLLNIDKTDAFRNLVKVLAGQVGSLISYSELSSTLNISYQTVKKYLWYCQKTFLLELISPFARNIRKEISQSPVSYFHDLGLRNYSLGQFGYLNNPSEMGFVFENFVYLILKTSLTQNFSSLHFWRTKDKAEVDFIIEQGNDVIPVEVKFKKLKREEITRSLRSFISKYNPPRAYCVNLDFFKEVELGSTKLVFVPYHELLNIFDLIR